MSILKLKPLEDRILIKQTEAPDTTEGGLHVPDTMKEKLRPAEGIVVAVGPGLVRGDNLILRAIYELFYWMIKKWAVGADDVPERVSTFQSMTVKPGDYVTFGRYAGTRIEYNKQEYMMVRQADVFMIDEEKTEELKSKE